MISSKKRSVFCLLLTLVVLIGGAIHVSRTSVERNSNEEKYVASRPQGTGGQKIEGPKDQEEIDQARIRNKLQTKEPLPELRPIEAYKEVVKLFTEHEAPRAKLLATTRHGEEIWYLLRVEPPSPDEIKSIRKSLDTIQTRIPKDNIQDFDELTQRVVKGYDPFGTMGARAMLIKVPDDPNGKIRGMIFDTEGIEADIAKFAPSSHKEYVLNNMVGYVRDDGKIPERFSALLKVDPEAPSQSKNSD